MTDEGPDNYVVLKWWIECCHLCKMTSEFEFEKRQSHALDVGDFMVCSDLNVWTSDLDVISVPYRYYICRLLLPIPDLVLT